MKKIIHIQVLPKMSGVQQVSFDILSGINDENVQKFILCGLPDGCSDNEFKKKFTDIGVRVITIPTLKRNIGWHDFRCFIDLYNFFKKEKFDIVHTNSTKPGIIARIAARLAGTKLIIHTVHGIAFHRKENTVRKIFYYCLENFATLFGSINVTVNENYLKYYPFVKSHIIYNGVDFNVLCCNKKDHDFLHIAFMARLDKQKNPLEFIRAVNIIKKKLPNERLKFTLAGCGELENECKKLIEHFHLTDVIDMPGWIVDKNTFYNSVDIICQPSNWEAFGLVFVEAAFFEIPSVSRNIEGIPEVILDNETGLLYEGGEAELSEKLISLIHDKKKISWLGLNAKEYVLKHFTKDIMVEKYSKLYDL